MVSSVSTNPVLTTNYAGSFRTQSLGYVQGCAQPDPATRFALASGYLASAETLPMWGGTLIFENLAPAATNDAIGNSIGRALSIATATGMCVFDQAYNAINSPQSPVPLIVSGMTLNFYRFGSGARIPVKCDPALISLDTGSILQQVSWDFINQQLIQFNALDAQVAISAMTWSAGVVTVTTASPHGRTTGDWVGISGVTPAGYNGGYLITVVDTTHFTYALASNPGSVTVQGVVLAGGGALPCKILNVQQTGNKTVSYDPNTGFASWNTNDCCALIQI